MFGADLAKFCKRQNTQIPQFLIQFMEHIERVGMDTVGLYRLSGNMASVQKLRCLVEQGTVGVVLCEIDNVVMDTLATIHLHTIHLHTTHLHTIHLHTTHLHTTHCTLLTCTLLTCTLLTCTLLTCTLTHLHTTHLHTHLHTTHLHSLNRRRI